MMYNVLSFRQAIDSGFDPKLYVYGKDIPLGVYEVELDFKIWRDGFTPAITLFCHILETRQLIRFNVYRNSFNGMYFMKDTIIDANQIEYGTQLLISVELNKKGNHIVEGLCEFSKE